MIHANHPVPRRAFLKASEGKGMTFHPAVLTVIPKSELRWLGRFLGPGIFDGEHYFQIEQFAPSCTPASRFSAWLGFIALPADSTRHRSGLKSWHLGP
jgi:hypothetical protein